MKNLSILILALLLSTLAQAQTPALFNYQGVARDAAGAPLDNANIGVKISILTGTATGTEIYSEEHTVTTNDHGLFSLAIGDGTTTDNIAQIKWYDGKKFVKVEIDPAGGTSYTTLGSSELLAVPYARMSNGLIGSDNDGYGIRGGTKTWLGIYENDDYRGYIGSWSGAAEDVDFGTGAGNTTGSVHLTIDTHPVLTINSDERVGILTTDPESDLHIDQSGGNSSNEGTGGITLENGSHRWRIYNSNAFIRFNYASGTAAYTPKSYISQVNGSFNQVSDATMKKDISAIGPLMNKVMKLEPKTYHYKDNSEGDPLSYGFLAQDVQKLFPEFVSQEEEEGLLGIDYAGFGVIAIKAIQEQQKLIEQLEKRIEELESTK